MASSNDRDKDSRSESKPENPFIRFRQFADTQISSLLQGVLGIPSAFSKPTDNPRWAVFDEDLRRRDELIARQQALRESEARRQKEDAADEGVEIPVKTLPGWKGAHSPLNDRSVPYKPLGVGSKDLPLYSPVEKTLFATLAGLPPADNTWGLGKADVGFVDGPEDAMRYTRSFAYNHLSLSGLYQSQKSLLPYLLFSPYSPIRLESDRMSFSRTDTPDPFPYSAAFADLLATTSASGRSLRIPSDLTSPFTVSPAGKARHNWRFIEYLHSNGFLQEPKTSGSNSDSSHNNPRTEQDMYDMFLRMASLPMAATNTFESLFKEVETAIEKEIGPEAISSLREQKAAFEKEPAAHLREIEELLRGLGDAFKEEKDRVKTTDAAQDSSRVVSTRTITEHSSHEDGSVETHVTVEKIFADGRTTSTTRSHTVDMDDSVSKKILQGSESENKSDENVDQVDKPAKKSWFWN